MVMGGYEFLYLSRADVEAVALSMREVIGLVERVFLEKGRGKVEMPPKPGIHTKGDSFIHAMPAYISSLKAAGMKWVSGYPENPALGLPYIGGLIVLNDPDTGFPLSVMDCTWVTASRTGAATAVAARYLAVEKPRRMAMVGCGVQGKSNAAAILAEFPSIRTVSSFDIDKGKLDAYVLEMGKKHSATFIAARSPKDAVKGAEIIVTATPILKHPVPVIRGEWFEEGSFGCPLDFDSYWTPEAMHLADKFCTDDASQLEYYKTVGYFSDVPRVYASLEEVVSGRKTGRGSEKERTLSMNLGIAAEDIAVASAVYEKAVKLGVGTHLPS